MIYVLEEKDVVGCYNSEHLSLCSMLRVYYVVVLDIVIIYILIYNYIYAI